MQEALTVEEKVTGEPAFLFAFGSLVAVRADSGGKGRLDRCWSNWQGIYTT